MKPLQRQTFELGSILNISVYNFLFSPEIFERKPRVAINFARDISHYFVI